MTSKDQYQLRMAMYAADNFQARKAEIPAYLLRPGHKVLLYGEECSIKKVHISPKGNFVTVTFRLRSQDEDMTNRFNRRSKFEILSNV